MRLERVEAAAAAIIHDPMINLTSGPLESLRKRVLRTMAREEAAGAAAAVLVVKALVVGTVSALLWTIGRERACPIAWHAHPCLQASKRVIFTLYFRSSFAMTVPQGESSRGAPGGEARVGQKMFRTGERPCPARSNALARPLARPFRLLRS